MLLPFELVATHCIVVPLTLPQTLNTDGGLVDGSLNVTTTTVGPLGVHDPVVDPLPTVTHVAIPPGLKIIWTFAVSSRTVTVPSHVPTKTEVSESSPLSSLPHPNIANAKQHVQKVGSV